MSPWPIERPRRPVWVGRLSQHWQRPHTLFVEPGAVWAWPPGAQRQPERYDDVQAWCGEHGGESARLVLSGRLSLQVVAHQPSLAMADPVTIAAWARHQFNHYHGAEAEAWPVATWADGEVAGAAALRGLDLPSVLEDALAHGVSLSSAQPWWAGALRAISREQPQFGRQPRAGLLLVEGAAATWLVCERGTIVALQQRWLDAADATAVIELLQSLAAEQPPDMPRWMLGYGCRGFGEEAAPLYLGGNVEVLSFLGAARPARKWVDA